MRHETVFRVSDKRLRVRDTLGSQEVCSLLSYPLLCWSLELELLLLGSAVPLGYLRPAGFEPLE